MVVVAITFLRLSIVEESEWMVLVKVLSWGIVIDRLLRVGCGSFVREEILLSVSADFRLVELRVFTSSVMWSKFFNCSDAAVLTKLCSHSSSLESGWLTKSSFSVTNTARSVARSSLDLLTSRKLTALMMEAM